MTTTPMTHAIRLSLVSLLSLLVAVTSVQAHVEVGSPPPLRSVNNKAYSFDSFDYSMTSPLNADGSNFPCKLYMKDVPSISQAVTTLTAGQTTTVSFKAGGATHGGGSCQFSLSYDNGKTFGVIHSVIGGCPIQNSYTFTVPGSAPAGKNILLSWSWQNKIGNRELYQNCIAINLESSTTSPMKVPRMFEANIFGPGVCNTIEGDEVVYPNPGDSVTYGGKWAGQKPSSSDFQIKNCNDAQLASQKAFVTLSGNGTASPNENSGVVTTSPEGQSSAALATSSSSKSGVVIPPVSVSLGIPPQPLFSTSSRTAIPASASSNSQTDTSVTSSPVSAPSPSSARAPLLTSSTPAATGAPANGASGDNCSGSELRCSDDGQSFSVCANGKWVSMGSVAAGTTCRDGTIVATAFLKQKGAPQMSCRRGQLKCSDDGLSFALCGDTLDKWIEMGPVAKGTVCKDGVIGLASTKFHREVQAVRHSHLRRLDSRQ